MDQRWVGGGVIGYSVGDNCKYIDRLMFASESLFGENLRVTNYVTAVEIVNSR